MNVMVHTWTFGNMEDLAEKVKQMPEDWIIVTPSQLAELAKQAREKGWHY